MEDVKHNIAQNLIELRKANNWTQSELANKLNYSDKSISKWERGESIPDVETLVLISEVFNVSLDYLVQSEHEEIVVFDATKTKYTMSKTQKHFIITLLSLSAVWLSVLTTFCLISIFSKEFIWQIIVGGVPASILITMIFNCIWGRRYYTYLFLSLLLWSTIATIYVSLLKYTPWQLFIIGIPLQIADILWYFLDYNARRPKLKKDEIKEATE